MAFITLPPHSTRLKVSGRYLTCGSNLPSLLSNGGSFCLNHLGGAHGRSIPERRSEEQKWLHCSIWNEEGTNGKTECTLKALPVVFFKKFCSGSEMVFSGVLFRDSRRNLKKRCNLSEMRRPLEAGTNVPSAISVLTQDLAFWEVTLQVTLLTIENCCIFSC